MATPPTWLRNGGNGEKEAREASDKWISGTATYRETGATNGAWMLTERSLIKAINRMSRDILAGGFLRVENGTHVGTLGSEYNRAPLSNLRP